MTKDYLEKLAEKYNAKSERAFMSYQQTGIQRYLREYENSLDFADAFRMAANAADDHNALGIIKSEFTTLASQADRLLNEDGDLAAWEKLGHELISAAAAYCKYARRESL